VRCSCTGGGACSRPPRHPAPRPLTTSRTRSARTCSARRVRAARTRSVAGSECATAGVGEAFVGGSDVDDHRLGGEIIGDDVVELAAEPADAFPVAAGRVAGRGIPAGNDLFANRPRTLADGADGRWRRGVRSERATVVGVEADVARSDVDNDLAGSEVVGDDLVEGATKSRESFPVAPGGPGSEIATGADIDVDSLGGPRRTNRPAARAVAGVGAGWDRSPKGPRRCCRRTSR
jgi:hypothetical protein